MKMILLGNGSVWTFGDNEYKQLGFDTLSNSNNYSEYISQITLPEAVSALNGEYVIKLSAGADNSAFVTTSGKVYVWGDNASDQLLDPTVFGVNAEPREVKVDNKEIADIQYGGTRSNSTHTIVLTRDGDIYTWGKGAQGQLGNGYTNDANKAQHISVNGGDNVWAISAGGTNTVVILEDGYVYAWGSVDKGQIGDGTAGQNDTGSESYQPVPTKTGEDYISLDKYFVTLHTGETANIEAVYNKFFNVMKSIKPGVVFSTEVLNNTVANATATSTGMTITPVATGKTQVIISGDGKQATVEVTVLGDGFSTVPQVGAGAGFTVALDKDGKVYTWGVNNKGQLGNGGKETSIIPTNIRFDFADPSTTYITRIEVGIEHTLALDNTGKLWAWGSNDRYAIGNNKRDHALKPVQIRLPDNAKPVEIAVGETTSYAIDEEGHIYAWGNVTNNEGYGTTPVKLDLFERMIEVSGKMGLRADGTVWNIPTTSKASLIIKKDTGDRRFVQISSNDYFGTNQNTDPDSKHTLLVTKDGKLYAFGNNQNGELGVGSGNVGENELLEVKVTDTGSKVIDTTTGRGYSAVVTEDGEVYAWGTNTSYKVGQPFEGRTYYDPVKVNYPETAKKLTFISGGADHTAAIDEDGYVWSFGANNNSQLGNQDNANSYIPVIAGTMKMYVKPQVLRIDKDGSLNVKDGDANNDGLTVTVAEYLNLLGRTTDDNDNKAYTVRSLDTDIVTVDIDGVTIHGIKEGKAILEVMKTATQTIGYATVYVGRNGGIYPMVDGGENHSIALKADGTVWTWGRNHSGQLGISDSNSVIPVQITLPGNQKAEYDI